MLRRTTLALCLALAPACTVQPNREDWPEQFSDAFCDWERRCMASSYFDNWDDHESCLDETSDDVDDILDALPGCDFDERRAEDCLNRLNDNCRESGDLQEIASICLDVLDC